MTFQIRHYGYIMDGIELCQFGLWSVRIIYNIILAAGRAEIVSLVHARDEHKQKVAMGGMGCRLGRELNRIWGN